MTDRAGRSWLMAAAISTSPLGRTSIQRGWSRPPADALTLSPGAATGVCPSLHPRAVGIFRVGMLPCGRPAGIVGALPHAGSGEPLVSRRTCSAAPPTRATPRAKRVEKLTVGLLFQSSVCDRGSDHYISRIAITGQRRRHRPIYK